MATDRMRIPSLLMVCVVAVAGLGLGGCGGETAEDQLWEFALSIEHEQGAFLQAGGEQAERAHQMAARALDRALQSHGDAPENLRRVLAAIQEGEQRLADGAVRGAEAEALRARHEEYWSHLRRRELPPDYR